MDVEFRGRIHTLEGEAAVESLVIRDGRIVHAGARVHGTGPRVIDLDGAVMLPAFVDSHAHPVITAETTTQMACTAPAIGSVPELLAEVDRRSRAAAAGQWIQGWGYDEGKWPEGRVPTRAELDAVSHGHPVMLVRACGHIGVANTVALEIGGVLQRATDPPEGQIRRDERGEPTGELREMAQALVTRHIPALDAASRMQGLEETSAYFASHGISYVTDMACGRHLYDEWDAYAQAVREGRWRLGVGLFVVAERARQGLPTIPADIAGQVELLGIKLFADGSITGRTAAVREPFEHSHETGMLLITAEDVRQAGTLALREGLQLSVHAMGERAIDLVVRAMAELAGGAPAYSFVIEHGSLPTEQAIDLMARHGIGVNTQPIFAYAEIESYLQNLGERRMAAAYPLRTLLASGVPLALSSDVPSTAHSDPANPWLGIALATERVAHSGFKLDPAERIPLRAALRGYSEAGAAMRRHGRLGRLASQYDADFAVWEQDPFQVGPLAMAEHRALATYRRGSVIHAAPHWRA